MHKQILVANAVLALMLAPAPILAQDEGIHWLGNYKEALEEAGRTGKPIFLEYRCEP